MDDKELIRLYENRDERAIVGTAEKYGSYCRSIGTNILHSSEDCEECFDDALMKLWESIPPDKPRDLGAYLATAMRNLALSRYRKRTAQKRSGDQVALALDELSEVLPDRSDVAEQLDANELMQGVNEFLRSLPKKKRLLFVRKYFYLDSLTDAAEYSGIDSKKAAVTLFRIRKQLAQYLDKQGLL